MAIYALFIFPNYHREHSGGTETLENQLND